MANRTRNEFDRIDFRINAGLFLRRWACAGRGSLHLSVERLPIPPPRILTAMFEALRTTTLLGLLATPVIEFVPTVAPFKYKYTPLVLVTEFGLGLVSVLLSARVLM